MFLSTLLRVRRSLPELFAVCHFVVVVQFHTVQVSCWSDWTLWWVFSAWHIVHRSFFCCPCIFAFQRYPFFTVFCHFDPCVVLLHIISCCRFSLFQREEFVNLVFPSSFWSSYGSVGCVFCVEIRVPFSCFLPIFRPVAMRFSSPISISFICEFLIQQWIVVVFICSMASSVLLFMYSIQSSSSITAVSISSSVSLMKEMLLS